jgi:hypothetical protein
MQTRRVKYHLAALLLMSHLRQIDNLYGHFNSLLSINTI